MVGGPDCRLADGLAKGISERVQGAPPGAMAGNDMADIKGPQPLDRVGYVPFHHASEMQSAHYRVDRGAGEEVCHMRAYIDDTGVRAGAEYSQTEAVYFRHEEPFVQ